jgi:putative spermidine/putrescine transport system ATP-binding protein
MPFLVLEGLTKRYGDQVAVEGMDLTVEKGEFVSLLGPSGCGKTTTLQMIAGFVDPTAGGITLDGTDLLAVRPSKRGLGIVFQSYALFPHITAAENVAFGLEMRGIVKPERDRRVAEALALVGLSALADRYPRRMSGGQQQRVALARALVIKPSVLLLDEPLSNLDAKLREEMQIELRTIQRTVGTTTILVTHDQSEAMALSDRIVVMNKGRVEQIARPEEAYSRPASPFVASFLGKTNVFSGEVVEGPDGADFSLSGARFKLGARLPAGPALARVRQERVTISAAAASGVRAKVRTRVFQGAHWLFQLDTPAGAAVVLAPNDGTAMPLEGEDVTLSWKAEDMSVSPGAAA